MESKKYITSKSKTFKEGSDSKNIVSWLLTSIDTDTTTLKPPCYDVVFKSKQKYKITITNLK